MTNETENELIDFVKINRDINGNPRVVCHFLTIADNYSEAVKLANTIGGRKYHTKSYGGGLVFQANDLPKLIECIQRIKIN